jgi:hypothetical protein
MAPTVFDLDLLVEQVAIVVKEIQQPKIVSTSTEEPRKLQLGPGKLHCAVLMGDGTLGQVAAGTRGELHRLVMRFYINWEQNIGRAEKLVRQTMAAVQVKMESNVTLNDTNNVLVALVQGDYGVAYQKVSGVNHRVLDMPLEVIVRVDGVTWQQE